MLEDHQPFASTSTDLRAVQSSRARAQRDDRGSSIIEFAIIAPIFIMMLVGIVQIGLATYRLQGIHAATRDAARVGSMYAIDQDEIRATVMSSLESTLLLTPPVITIEPNTTVPCADGPRVSVTIEASSPYSIPFVYDSALTLSSKAEFACET